MVSTLNVPLIDLSEWYSGDPTKRASLAARVDRACREVGFMQVTGHGVPRETAEGLAAAIDGFFGQAPEDKHRWRTPDPGINRGYSPPRAEKLSHSLGVASPEDLFEAFNVGSEAGERPPTGAGADASPEDHSPNIWPQGVPGFRPRVEAWFGEAKRVAEDLTDVFALSLGLPEDFFRARCRRSIDVLRMNNYALPPGEHRVDTGQMGMGAHTDYGIVTVLWADAVPGLQILDGDGEWHDVLPREDALLVNLGDMLARWTNERWLSTLHRVLPPTDAEGRLVRRRSAAYFHDGDPDTVVETLHGCVSAERPARYGPITVREHLRQKLAGSRGLELNEEAGREAARLK
ncbi:2-oxoglutarate and iron-dependent oxygenase domain-containing protein [Streptomyces sp. ODS28]|uniref:isopenicillin N synthase family dioxygenase n=1 Tax=Streptomyces sp. ODS28 TaxID=3136688 RepID=UPI0031E831FF